MSKIFICLYLDEDVNVLVADLLKARGFDAITARDAKSGAIYLAFQLFITLVRLDKNLISAIDNAAT